MPSDLLIDRLTSGLKPVRPRSPARDIAILGLICAVELALFLGVGAMRPDMGMAMAQPSFWWKLTSMGLLAAIGGTVAILSFDPVQTPRPGLRWLGGLVVLVLAAGWGIDAAQDGWPALAARIRWQDGLGCVVKMAVLSLPAVIGLGVLMRRGAPADTAATAWAAGIAAAAWGAFVFVFACPFDDPLYLALWYTIGCCLVTLTVRLVLPPLTRW